MPPMHPRALPLAIALALGSGSASAYVLDDPLAGSSAGQVNGGALGPSGFTITGTQDSIVYVVPPLVSGSVEFTITGLTTDSLPAIDHEIFSMYDGFGLSEPVGYNPYFRNNNFKMLLRIYGQGEPTRTGMQKLLYAMCPVGDPVYSDGAPCPCPAFYNEEPFGGDTTWNGGPDVFRVAWTPTTATYFRNGVQTHSLDWASTGIAWGPNEQHIMLGSPRNELAPDVAMPLGVTYSNVHIEGQEGSPTPSCLGGTGGAGGSGGAGGTGGSGGGGGTGGGAGECSTDLAAAALSPPSGTGVSAVFAATYRYTGGADHLQVAQLFVGADLASGPNVNVGIDATTAFYENQTCTPGEAKVLQGESGALDCSLTHLTLSGTDATVYWALTFDPSKMSGVQGVFMDAKAQGDPAPRLCWTKMGEWEVPGDPDAGGAGGGTPDATAGWDAHDGGSGGTAGGAGPAHGSGDDESCACGTVGRHGSVSAWLLACAALAVGVGRRRRCANVRTSAG